MEGLADLDRFRDREDVEYTEESAVIDENEFETVREEYDSHVVVGVTNDDGAVLLTNDGTHGWTLPAFVVEPEEDAAETGRRGIEEVIGVGVEIDRPERVRRIEYQVAGDEDRRTTLYNVIYRAVQVEGSPVADEPQLANGVVEAVDWFDTVPEEQEGAVVDDIELFIE